MERVCLRDLNTASRLVTSMPLMGEARTEKAEIPHCAWFDVPVPVSGRT